MVRTFSNNWRPSASPMPPAWPTGLARTSTAPAESSLKMFSFWKDCTATLITRMVQGCSRMARMMNSRPSITGMW